MNIDEAKPLLVLPLLRKDFTEKNHAGLALNITIAIISISIGYILLKIIANTLVVVITTIVLSFIWGYVLRRLLPDWVKRKDVAGTLELFTDKVKLLENNHYTEYFIARATFFNILSNYYKGNGKGKIAHNGLLTFLIDIDNQQRTIKTVLSSEKEYDTMVEVLKQWYAFNILITEKFTEYKYAAFLLAPYSGYMDLKKAKAELGIS